jgi:hypothetical protein
MKINLKNKLKKISKIIFPIIVISGILFSPAFASATVLIDNFNAYSNGDLAGQGGWVRVGGTNPIVAGTYSYGGSGKSITGAGGWGNATLDISNLGPNTGFTYYIRTDGGTDQMRLAGQGTNGASFIVGLCSNGKFCWDGPGATEYGDDYLLDNWNSVEARWRDSPSNQVSFRFNGGSWTAWEGPMAPNRDPNSIWQFNIYYEGGGTGLAYLDNIMSGNLADPIPPAPPTGILTLASTTATNLLAYAGQLFTDLKPIMILLLGIPVGFFILKRSMGIVRKKFKTRG